MSSEEEAVAWLRKTIEGDLAAARIISEGGFAPERWDTEPPGQVNPEDALPREKMADALGFDRDDFPCGLPGWVQIVAYERENHEPPEAAVRSWGVPVALVDSGRRQFDHIIRHDPQNIVARCEAELAILDEHGGEHMCFENSRDGNTWAWYDGDCRIVRLLAGGYKHRPGYPSQMTLDLES